MHERLVNRYSNISSIEFYWIFTSGYRLCYLAWNTGCYFEPYTVYRSTGRKYLSFYDCYFNQGFHISGIWRNWSCVFVQFLDNNFLTPKIVGSSVSINPLATLIAIIIGGLIWGIIGMMIFIPLLGMLKVILDSFPKSQPFGYLIGEEVEMKSIISFKKIQDLIIIKKR
ncbi:MAG: AI-2E family transporter [Bacteroidetes bacterium]|nr:AI-2E family transporter [Bacteroidota bacterium]